MDSRGVSIGKYVAVAVGCYLFAFQWHFDGNSTAQEKLNIKMVSVLLSASVERVRIIQD